MTLLMIHRGKITQTLETTNARKAISCNDLLSRLPWMKCNYEDLWCAIKFMLMLHVSMLLLINLSALFFRNAGTKLKSFVHLLLLKTTFLKPLRSNSLMSDTILATHLKIWNSAVIYEVREWTTEALGILSFKNNDCITGGT